MVHFRTMLVFERFDSRFRPPGQPETMRKSIFGVPMLGGVCRAGRFSTLAPRLSVLRC